MRRPWVPMALTYQENIVELSGCSLGSWAGLMSLGKTISGCERTRVKSSHSWGLWSLISRAREAVSGASLPPFGLKGQGFDLVEKLTVKVFIDSCQCWLWEAVMMGQVVPANHVGYLGCVFGSWLWLLLALREWTDQWMKVCFLSLSAFQSKKKMF